VIGMTFDFTEWKKLYGFDLDLGIFPTQVIPKGGYKWVKLRGGKGGSLEPLRGKKPNTVQIVRTLDRGFDRYFKLKGVRAGDEYLVGKASGKTGDPYLIAMVRQRKTVAIGLKLWRSKRKIDDINKAIMKVNQLYLSQANVRFTCSAGVQKIGKKDASAIKKKIGKRVDYSPDTKDFSELEAFFKYTQSAGVTLFFVPSLDNSDSRGDTNGTQRTIFRNSGKQRKVIFIEDKIPGPLENVSAHELGHYLGLSHETTSPNNIMYSKGSCKSDALLAVCPSATGQRQKIETSQVSTIHG
jgi:hypothetical protein